MSEPKLSVVVIGRNEGERLRRCIDTLVQQRRWRDHATCTCSIWT
jgi:glycosyltransferase involved in cell wall biosynthesis